MATNIPPHNLGEVIDATVHLIEHPDATLDDLMQFVKGPDFPTGALIMGRQGILDAYRTGKGSIRLRAVAEIEERASRPATASSSPRCPTRRPSRRPRPRIKELVETRAIEGIADVNDESARGKTRLVIELKKDAPGLVVLNNLYKHTPLQTNFSVNTVALVDGVPRTLNLVQALQAYIDHQVEVIRRRTEYRLRQGREAAPHPRGPPQGHRRHRRRSSPPSGPATTGRRQASRSWPSRSSSARCQAEDILDMTLGPAHPPGPDRPRDRDRRAAPRHRRARGDPRRRGRAARRHQGRAARRSATSSPPSAASKITLDPGDMNIEDLIDDEELVVTLSAKGYTKTVAADTFRAQGRGGKGVAGAKLRDDDYVTHILTTTAHAYLLFFSNLGRVYRLKAHEIPKKERTARGTAIVNLLPAPAGRAHPGDHRHPRLRDATATCSSPPSRAR